MPKPRTEISRRPNISASLRAQILEIVKPEYRHLYGSFLGKYSPASRNSAWKEIWKVAKDLPNLKKSLPDLAALRKRVSDWKGQVKQKITAQNATGSCPEDFSQSETLIWHMLNENNEFAVQVCTWFITQTYFLIIYRTGCITSPPLIVTALE